MADLSDDEKELLEKHRAEKKKASDAERSKKQVHWYEKDPDGTERGASMDHDLAKSHGPAWLKKQLADEEAKAEDGEDTPDDEQPAKPVRFGRRVG